MKTFLLTLALLFGPALAKAETAIVAGGCFWCVESDFESVPGVQAVVSGYTGGTLQNPTYKQVSHGGTGHYEAVKITFDGSRISFDEIMRLFFRSVDPTDPGGQFCDRGDSYRTAVFFQNDAQKTSAEAAKAEAAKALGQKIATKVLPAGPFWTAEDYHQDYYKGQNVVLTRAGPKKQANAYRFYRSACGRDQRVKQLWGGQAAFAH